MEQRMNKQSKIVKVLKGRMVIDGTGGSPVEDAVIVIEDQRIKEVGAAKGMKLPSDAEIIDLSNFTLMPGLIDTHLHLFAANSVFFENYRLAEYVTHPNLQMLYALRGAQVMLEAGFTTIRNHAHSTSHASRSDIYEVAIRDALQAGLFPGPRMLTGGCCHITGGHLDLVTPRAARRSPGLTADGPWELRRLGREILRAGADFLKTCLSGGGGTAQEAPDIRNMTQEEVDAVADEAHSFGKQCAAHCFTPLAQKMAVRAKVDTIEHCVFTDDEAIAMIKGEDKFLVPTLAHRSDRAIELRYRHGAPKDVFLKMKRIQPYCWESFKKIHQAGIKIAMGTDTTVDPEVGKNAYELEIYVDLGMTPMEAIQTATKNAAEAIGLGRETGTLEPGKYADIIAVDGNPLSDIRVLQDKEKVKLVVKEGQILVDRLQGNPQRILQQPIFQGAGV
jgi:imidazolonepropionase-like amidohydrolase